MRYITMCYAFKHAPTSTYTCNHTRTIIHKWTQQSRGEEERRGKGRRGGEKKTIVTLCIVFPYRSRNSADGGPGRSEESEDRSMLY